MLTYSSPTPKARAKLLRKSEDQFRRSDESAYSIDSIIPSQLSLSTNQRHSLVSSSQGSLEYHPLSFENKLFMSRVYMRKSKSMMIKKLFRVRVQSKEKTGKRIQPIPTWEDIQSDLEADSLLPSSEEISVRDSETVRPYSHHQEGGRSLQGLDASSMPAPKLNEMLLRACEQGDNV